MAAKYWFFTGKCKWAKVDQPDRKYGSYQINLYPDKASLVKFKETGLRLEIKKDDDGEFVRFRRDPEKLLEGMDEKPVKLIFDTETGKYKPFDQNIGNGSLVEVKVQVYDSAKGKGHRLEAVAVHELVPYEGDADQADLPF